MQHNTYGQRMPLQLFMVEKIKLLIDKIDTPIGEFVIVADEEGRLRALDWSSHKARLQTLLQRYCGGFTLTPSRNPYGFADALHAYFSGDTKVIDKLPVRFGGTPFQQRVWTELRNIACGTTISYSELARRIDQPKAVRAVGLANGSNPLSVVVPCHRVIGANGKLTGYGGGIERKYWLLAHEGNLQTFLSEGESNAKI
jgi:methylated-DNA-[protein]-cysteine S-methyltransferase